MLTASHCQWQRHRGIWADHPQSADRLLRLRQVARRPKCYRKKTQRDGVFGPKLFGAASPICGFLELTQEKECYPLPGNGNVFLRVYRTEPQR